MICFLENIWLKHCCIQIKMIKQCKFVLFFLWIEITYGKKIELLISDDVGRWKTEFWMHHEKVAF